MSPAPPDDPHSRSPDPAAAFEQIIAGLRAEGDVPVWPEERCSASQRAPEAAPERARSDAAVAPIPPEDDHFVPPDPPPMPPLGQAAAVGVALLALGVLLVVAPDLLGLSEAAGLTLGLITLAGGLGWLVLRSWSTDPPGDADPADDGARF